MKNIASGNTESIVYIVENEAVRRMLKMYLAAVGLNARAYSSTEDYQAFHDSSCTQYLVLDMPLPGMDGAILQRQRDTTDSQASQENAENFQLIPIKKEQNENISIFSCLDSRETVFCEADHANTILNIRGRLQ